jgi:hypothetical protein
MQQWWKVVSETNSEYIDIELNITGLVHGIGFQTQLLHQQ